MPEKKVVIDVQGAIDHYSRTTGEELSFWKLSKETGVPQQSLAKWAEGESLKTIGSVVIISKFTGYPLNKLITNK